jgi:hypothetical protein
MMREKAMDSALQNPHPEDHRGHQRISRRRSRQDPQGGGRRIPRRGRRGPRGWETHDWRTGECLASGDGGYDEYSAATAKLDPDARWYHIDHITEDLPDYDISATAGIPPSLAEVLVDWVETAPPEEITVVTAWDQPDPNGLASQ